jgi:hypothetical protein
MQKLKKFYACLLCFFLLNAVPSYAATDAKPEQHALDQIRAYISTANASSKAMAVPAQTG